MTPVKCYGDTHEDITGQVSVSPRPKRSRTGGDRAAMLAMIPAAGDRPFILDYIAQS